MDDKGAKGFIKYLHEHPEVREVLKDAILDELVVVGRAEGFEFTADDLRAALPGPPPTPGSALVGGPEWKN